MIPSSNSSGNPATDRAILLSIKPRFASLIIEGSKTIELRRLMPAHPVSRIAIYSTSPIQAIVGVVQVVGTLETSRSKLWSLAREHGGGLTRAELINYFDSKATGFAYLLGSVSAFNEPINPRTVIKEFSAPQSFRYLSDMELRKLDRLLAKER